MAERMTVSFGEIVWLMLVGYLLVAYLVVLGKVFFAIFRDPGLGGPAKAAWVVALIFVPLISLAVYLVVHGSVFARRGEDQDYGEQAYVRRVEGTG
jgi:hypothetical protein